MTVDTLEPKPQAPSVDAADIALARDGDRPAFERLYRRHVPRVFALCLRMAGDRGRAEELTQDAFVRAWEKLGSYRGEAAFSTWLHRLTVNVVLGAQESEGRRAGRFDGAAHDMDAHVARAPAPAGLVDLEGAIAALPRGARTVFVLFDVYGYSHEEIAGMLGISPGGSKSQLHRARHLLREALDR